MLNPLVHSRFKKDVKRCTKRGKKMPKLRSIMDALMAEKTLPPLNKDHTLTGNWSGFRECHIEPDWLLIHQVAPPDIHFVRTGSHSDLFN